MVYIWYIYRNIYIHIYMNMNRDILSRSIGSPSDDAISNSINSCCPLSTILWVGCTCILEHNGGDLCFINIGTGEMLHGSCNLLNFAFFLIFLWIQLLLRPCDAFVNINCTSLGISDIECGYYVIKVVDTYINVDQNYSKYLPPISNYGNLPITVNVTMGLNHIPSVDVLAGTVEVFYFFFHCMHSQIYRSYILPLLFSLHLD